MVTAKEPEGGTAGAEATGTDTGTGKDVATEQPRVTTPTMSPPEEFVVERTRTSTVFVMAAVALVLALLMLVFVLQNGDSERLEFLWFDFTLPAGVAMLLAAIVGGLIVASLGLGRVVQLRLAARRHRQVDRRSLR
jgi:uncharacterized integral membrane protein